MDFVPAEAETQIEFPFEIETLSLHSWTIHYRYLQQQRLDVRGINYDPMDPIYLSRLSKLS